MRFLNIGSLNLDFVYTVEHFVTPKETLASKALAVHCGGKGLNQSIALGRAGAQVCHAGAVGPDGMRLTEYLQQNGVDTSLILTVDEPTGNAVIQVDEQGQNGILLYSGANGCITGEMVSGWLSGFAPGDWLVLQNETSALAECIALAKQKGLHICLNAAPANQTLHACALTDVTLLVVNEVEGAYLAGKTAPQEILDALRHMLPNTQVLLTLGKAGAYFDDGKQRLHHAIYNLPVADTTAAGDTFTGFFLASWAQYKDAYAALEIASKASALAVGRQGAARSIPTMDEVIGTNWNISGR